MVQAQDICQQPKKVGPCKAAHPRFYFNKDAGKCEEFTYGGCGGNENNFKTLEACQAKCTCHQPKEVGPCKAALPSFYFDHNAGKCKDFTYGGCKGNANNFEKLEACQEMCICQQPKEVGPCFAAYQHFYFDKNAGECKNFIYGGCKGNANKFKTKRACKAKTSECRGICELPKAEGPCKAAFPRFYFDKDAGRCKTFTYGGCQGNANNFDTEESCQAKCGK